MTEQHKLIHDRLHKALDELISDYVIQTGGLLKETSVMTLLEWSFEQTKNPADRCGEYSMEVDNSIKEVDRGSGYK